jgi:hypothetical protein
MPSPIAATPQRSARLVYVDAEGLRCAVCGSELCPPAEAVELEHGFVHVACAGDRELAARGGA